MLHGVPLKPITGTFVNMLISDTGIVNAGLKEWEQDFQMMKAMGMDQLFVIRTEHERDGVHLSAEDPRSTTWPEDECLLDMGRHIGMKVQFDPLLGGVVRTRDHPDLRDRLRRKGQILLVHPVAQHPARNGDRFFGRQPVKPRFFVGRNRLFDHQTGRAVGKADRVGDPC